MFSDKALVPRLSAAQCFFVAALLAVIPVLILRNPNEAIGGIDAFFYSIYPMDFGDLVNRYGPHYYSYRISHFSFLGGLLHIFPLDQAYKINLFFKYLFLSLMPLILFRNYVTPLLLAVLVGSLLTAPWMVRAVSTFFTGGSSLLYLCFTLFSLCYLARSSFTSVGWAFVAGSAYSLAVNTNTSLGIFGLIMFSGFFVGAMRYFTLSDILKSGISSVSGFIFTQICIFLIFSSFMHFVHGTPWKIILVWLQASLAGSAHNMDMFGVAIARSTLLQLAADPKPSLVRILNAGGVEILAPFMVLMGCAVARFWGPSPSSERAERDPLSVEFNLVILSFFIAVLYVYITSESLGNLSIDLPYYFVYLLPLMAWAAFYLFASCQYDLGRLCSARAELVGERVAFGILVLPVLIFVVVNMTNGSIIGALGLRKLAAAGIGVIAAAIVLIPVCRERFPIGLPSASLLVAGTTLLFYIGSPYYLSSFDVEQRRQSADVVDAQVQLLAFTKQHRPPPGLAPNGNVVLVWHPNSAFTVSLTANFLSGNYTLHGGHTTQGLPVLDSHAQGRLRSGAPRELVLVYQGAEQGERARAALRDFGVNFESIGRTDFNGRRFQATFEYLKIPR